MTPAARRTTLATRPRTSKQVDAQTISKSYLIEPKMSDFYEWDKKAVLELIEIYKNYESLWNSKHPDYTNKDRRFDALYEIAKRLNIDKREIERKFKNLSSNYLRELKKVKESKLRGGPAYRSKWYAYKPLKYLNKRPIHHRSRGTVLDPVVCALILKAKGDESTSSQIPVESSSDSDEEEPTVENDEYPTEYDEATPENATPPHDYNPKGLRSTVLIKVEDPLTKSYEEEEEIPLESTSYQDASSPFESTSNYEPCNIINAAIDEPATFGEYIAKKIRPMDKKTKAIVEYEINSIIFKAEMGFYKDKIYDHVQ